MRTESGLAGRERDVLRVADALARGGATLVGPAGVGKSRLAAEVADRHEVIGEHVIRLRATTGSAELPLGAFLGQLGPTERFLTPLFAELRQRIREDAAGRSVLLLVDDVDLLDDSSAVLIHQFVVAGEARLLTTMRTGRLPASEILDLWQRGEVQRLEIGVLDAEGTGDVAAAMLGARLDGTSILRLHAATEGNALFIREVLLAAQEHGGFERALDGTLRLAQLPATADRLVGIVETRLGQLSSARRRALLHVAFAEPCGYAEVACAADLDVLASLEQDGLVTTALDGKRLVIHLAHPLYGEVLRAATPTLQKRQILASLAQDLAATGARRRSDRLKLARLAVDGGVPLSASMLVAAASTAYHSGDLVLAERIGRAAFDGDSSFSAGWDLAYSLYQQGQIEATQEHLRQWAARATNDGERRALAMVTAQLEFWYVGDLAAAERTTQEAVAAFPSAEAASPGASADELIGNLALFVALSGEFERAVRIATPLLDEGPGPVLIRAALAVANALGAMGQLDETIAQLDRAVQVFAAIGQEAINLSERIFFSVRSVANAWRGELDEAERDAYRARNESTNEFENAAAHFSSALVPILRGRPSEAIAFAERTFAWWALVQPGSTERRWALARLAWAHAEAGSYDRAEAILDLFDADASPGILFDHEAALARAAVVSAKGAPDDGAGVLRSAMDEARTRGYVVGELHLAYALARRGLASEVVTRLAELAADSQGRLPRAFAAHATAQANGDGPAILLAAEALGDIGCVRYATEAAVQAADAAQRIGDQRFARRCLARADEWRQHCEIPSSMVAIVTETHVPLTRREREIAQLAVAGLSSREVGERLYISGRTAENHLARVYEKLGIRSRTELANLLDRGRDDPAA